jgi:hypothetical protein
MRPELLSPARKSTGLKNTARLTPGLILLISIVIVIGILPL